VESADDPPFVEDDPDTSEAAATSFTAYSKTDPCEEDFEERQIRVFKGILAGSIQEMMKEDIVQALRLLKKPSSNKSEGGLADVLAGALEEQADGFELKFTYSCTVFF
jgi:hypothetical protein